jgi:hypothetical protein
MLRTITVALALLMTSSCAGALELGGKSAKKRVPRGADTAALDDATGDDEAGDEADEETGDDEGASKAKSARVKVSDKDPIGIQNAADELEKMEAALEKGDVADYVQRQQFLFDDLASPSEEVESSPRHKKLLAWMRALDLRAAAMAGGHAPEIMGDGKRFSDVDEDAVKAAEEALFACEQAAKTSSHTSAEDIKTLGAAYADYEKKLARVNKIDKRATRYAKVGDGRYVDMAPKFVRCEAQSAALRMEFEDTAVREDRVGGRYKDCGYSDWVFVALHLGRNKFGPFEIDGVHTDNGRAYPCKKFPRRSKVPAPLVKAMKRDVVVKKGEIMTMVGDYDVQRDGLDIKKYATIRLYSKETEINKSDCGETDPKVVCEASYSKNARAYNEVTHFHARAAVHRKAGRAARCKELLERARVTAEKWDKDRDENKGMRYKVNGGEVLSEEKITSAIEKLGSQADERAIGGWCAKSGK